MTSSGNRHRRKQVSIIHSIKAGIVNKKMSNTMKKIETCDKRKSAVLGNV